MADGGLHAKLLWRKVCRVEAVVQVSNGAWSALSKSIALSSFQTAYTPYLL